MKALLRRLASRLGYTILHRSEDPVLAELVRCHQVLRLQNSSPMWWNHELAKPASASVLRTLLHHHAIDLVIDIGANHGQFAQGLRTLGYAGEIVSFEPGRAARARLAAAAAGDPLWQVRAEALGATISEASLHVSASDVFSSFHAANDQGRSVFGAQLTDVTDETVSICPLDTLWPEISGNRPRRALLKCDTQGHEAEVLAGAVHTLPLICAAMMEGAVSPIYEGAPDWRTLIDALSPFGLTLSSVIPLSQRPSDLALLEVDLFFTRHHT